MGALEAVNGKEYVRLLRRAMDFGRFHQVIFICLSPPVWGLVDKLISIGSGCEVTGNQQETSPELGHETGYFAIVLQ